MGHNVGNFSAADRLVKVAKGTNMFLDNYLLGIGLHMYAPFYDFYMPLSLTEDFESVVPLNVYVEIAAELGIFGIIVFLFLLLHLFFRMNPIFKAMMFYLMANLNFYQL